MTRFRRARLIWRLLILAGLLLFLAGGTLSAVIAVQARCNQELFANQAAETLRKILGRNIVRRLEYTVFKLEQRTHRFMHYRPGRVNPRVVERLRQPLKDSPPPAADAGQGPPPSIEPLIESPPFPDEGRWQPLAAAHPGLWLTKIRPNAEESAYYVDLVAIDLRKLKLTYVPGTEVTDNPALSSIPAEARSSIIAVFNGGFRTEDKPFPGQRIAGIQYRPLAADKGSIVFAGASVDICRWNATEEARYSAADIRQNLPLLLDQGSVGEPLLQFLKQKRLDFPTYRSGLGLSADRRWLIFGIGARLEPIDLATAFRLASCRNAVHLDQNHGNVFFELLTENQSQPKFLAIEAALHRATDRKVLLGSNRDFFYVSCVK